MGQVLICLIKALFLKGLGIKGSDYHHPGKIFTGNQVEAVDELLYLLELRHCNRKYRQYQAQQYDHCQCNDPRHGGAFAQGSDYASYAHNRCIEYHPDHDDHQHLYLGDVIGGSGNQGGCGEFVKLCVGEAFYLCKYGFTKVSG